MTKSILITGASRGIGRATALKAGRLGWSVGVNYLKDVTAAEAVRDEIIGAGGTACLLQGDVSVEADVEGFFGTAWDQFGGLDCVVINAGFVAPMSRLADMSVQRMKRVFDVNIMGAYLCARAAARRMPRDRGGRGGSIVLVSSLAARMGSANQYVEYAGSKGATDTLTIGLAKELAPAGVRVNAVRPGLIDTEIHATSGDPTRARVIGAQTPMGRAGTADEIAEAILWLAGDASSYVTGSFIDAGGGR